MSRYDAIEKLFIDINESVDKIEFFYEEAKKDDNKAAEFNVKVKNILENLRSSLDFAAVDIAEYTGVVSKKIYFPYGKDENDFKSSIGRSFPGLQTNNPEVYNLLESFQPHKCGDNTIPDMCKMTNDNKHDDLYKYVRVNSTASTTTVPGFITIEGDSKGKIVISDVETDYGIIGSKGAVEIDGTMTAVEVGKVLGVDAKVITKKYAWVKFEINGRSVDVLEFLRRCESVIWQVINSVYSVIPK